MPETLAGPSDRMGRKRDVRADRVCDRFVEVTATEETRAWYGLDRCAACGHGRNKHRRKTGVDVRRAP